MKVTPQEKAKELIDKFLMEVRGADRYNYNLDSMNIFIAKQCALIAVDELINDCDSSSPFEEKRLLFWNDVKSELSKY